MKLKLIVGAMLAAVVLIATTPRGWAGPDPSNTRWYAQVKTMAEAEAIKPGAEIAMVCGKCGAVTTMVADKDRSFLHGFTCELCKDKFVVRQDSHGGSHADYVCEDDSGHRAQLLVKTK